MAVSFIQRSAAKRQSGGSGTISLAAHNWAAVGDVQMLAVSCFAANAVSIAGSWTVVHTRSNSYSKLVVYGRVLTSTDLLASSINVTVSDYSNAELRTYRVSADEMFVLNGSGDGLVAADATVDTKLVRCWASAQINTSGGSGKTLTPPAGLLNAPTSTSYNWYDGGLFGDDPAASGAAAGTSTALHSGGGETITPQWANLFIRPTTYTAVPTAVGSLSATALDSSLLVRWAAAVGAQTYEYRVNGGAPVSTGLAYSTVVAADAPIARYRLGETSGTTMADSSGGGHDGTYNNSPQLGLAGAIARDTDTAATFGTGGANATVPYWAGLNVSAEFTIEAWVYGFSAYPQPLVGRLGGSTAPWCLRNDEVNRIVFTIHDAANGFANYVGSRSIASAWHHVVVTRDATGTLTIYIDGGKDMQYANALAPATTTDGLGIATDAGATIANVNLDEVAIYDKALSPARVLAHYYAGAGVTRKVKIDGLANGTNYTVEARAVNPVGAGPWTSVQGVPAPATYYDDFDRPDAAVSPGEAVVGGPYTVVGAANWGTTGGALYTSSSTLEAMLTFPGLVDLDFTLTVSAFGTNGGLMFRWVDQNNTWLVNFTTTQISLWRRTAGTWTQHGNTWAKAPVAGDVIRLLAVGRTILVYRNGVEILNGEDVFISSATPTMGYRLSSDTNTRLDEGLLRPGVLPTNPPGDLVIPDYALVNPTYGQAHLYKGRDTKLADQGAVA